MLAIWRNELSDYGRSLVYFISTICGNLNLPPLVQPRDLTDTEKGGVSDFNICLISLVRQTIKTGVENKVQEWV